MTYTYTNDLEAEETKELVAHADSLAAHYDGFQVLNEVDYRNAGEDLKAIKAQQKEIETRRKAITKPMDEAKKAVMDFFRPFTDRLVIAETAVKNAMLTWKKAEDFRIAEEQRKAIEKADKEEARLRKRAEAARAKGQDNKADGLEEQASMVIAAPVPAVAKVKGISTSKIWKFKITDKNKVPRNYLIVDEVEIGKTVRTLKGDCDIPGVRVYCVEVMAAYSK